MIEDITERVVKRLISLRKDSGITREFLADEIGYPYYVIRRIEQQHSGNMDALLKIISFWKERVGLNVDELFFLLRLTNLHLFRKKLKKLRLMMMI